MKIADKIKTNSECLKKFEESLKEKLKNHEKSPY